MRLIDADALRAEHCDDCNADIQTECETYPVCGSMMWIVDAPTVEAVPVVHAHWEDGCAMHNGKEVYKSIDCSNCNEIFKIESHDREYWKNRFKVCPFCGAIMDGDGNG
jgi:hypothetical protein